MVMSLTSHLNDPKSAVRNFLFKRFPNIGPLVKECRNKLVGVQTICPPRDIPYRLIGTAIDYRIRYYFRASDHLIAYDGLVNYPEVVAWLLGWDKFPKGLTLEFMIELVNSLKKLRPFRRKLGRPQEELLNRYCIVLALFEQAYRAAYWVESNYLNYLRPNPKPIASPIPKPNLEGLLGIAKPHWIDDLCALSWLFYDRHTDLLTHRAKLNPVFDGSTGVGGADADFIVGRCLVEMKTTIDSKLPSLRRWLYQLLGYVLLDYSDRYRIRSVGLYLTRQGIMVKWPLEYFICTLTNDTAARLRERRKHLRRLAPPVEYFGL